MSNDLFPKTARTIRVSSGRGKTPTTPRVEQFKNPILGIEVNLIRQLQDVEKQYHGASYQKRKLLLDTLEQLANSNTGFKKQILFALNQWRRPPESIEEDKEISAISDLLRAQNEYKDTLKKINSKKDRIAKLKEQIETTKEETQKMVDETNAMKMKLFKESDHFAKARKLTEEMNELKKSFDGMFQRKKEEELTGQFAKMAAENDRLRADLARMKFELELCTQISKRMKFIDERESKQTDTK